MGNQQKAIIHYSLFFTSSLLPALFAFAQRLALPVSVAHGLSSLKTSPKSELL
ncbi:hypothetical protein [Moorena sp. SIO2C4]|uniref:hypothetical protein n=1 Tax=Moorena sp. SIO2C4 TaxID=2607824 RepID=UPI0002DD2A05|nr:hypothetical protein [Moorena sp. SIO2C4]NET69229.1 hypothetical protein [Moorena sp. SIO1G6]